MEEIHRQAEALAEERRLAREHVASWVIIQPDYEPERERKVLKKRKKKAEIGSGGEDGMSSGPEEEGPAKPKKVRKTKKAKKFVDPDEDAEDAEMMGSGEEDEGRAKPKVRSFFREFFSSDG